MKYKDFDIENFDTTNLNPFIIWRTEVLQKRKAELEKLYKDEKIIARLPKYWDKLDEQINKLFYTDPFYALRKGISKIFHLEKDEIFIEITEQLINENTRLLFSFPAPKTIFIDRGRRGVEGVERDIYEGDFLKQAIKKTYVLTLKKHLINYILDAVHGEYNTICHADPEFKMINVAPTYKYDMISSVEKCLFKYSDVIETHINRAWDKLKEPSEVSLQEPVESFFTNIANDSYADTSISLTGTTEEAADTI